MVTEWPGGQLGHLIQLAVVEYLAEKSGVVELLMMELLLLLVLLVTPGGGLSNCETSNRDTEGRARDVVQADRIEEFDGLGITTLLTTDGEAKLGIGRFALDGTLLDEESNALLIDGVEGIIVENTSLHVLGNKGAGIISRNSHSHLGQIVGSVAEEAAQTLAVGLVPEASDLIRDDRRTWYLYHCSNLVGNVDFALRSYIFGLSLDDKSLALKLLEVSNQGDHDARMGMATALEVIGSGVHNSTDLHLSQVFMNNTKAAATKAKHGILLVKSFNVLLELMDRVISEPGSNLVVDLIFVRDEFVKRRIEQSDCDFLSIHCLEDFVEVMSLEVLDLVKILFSISEDPVLNNRETLGREKHMLSTAQSNTLSTVLGSLGRILSAICVGKHLENVLLFIAPSEDDTQISTETWCLHLECSSDALAGASIETDDVPGLESLAGCLDLHNFLGLVHVKFRCATDTGLAPTASDDGGMAGLATLGCENTGL